MKTVLKTLTFLTAVLLLAATGQAQPQPQPPPMRLPPVRPAAAPPPHAVAPKPLVNYRIRVEWRGAKAPTRFLQVLTAEGQFNLNTIQKSSVKINDHEIPTTLKFSGTLTALDEHHGRLQLFLGRTVPYVTGSYGGGPHPSPSYSQLSVGLDATVIVTFGKPEVIQTDENGQVAVIVQRLEG